MLLQIMTYSLRFPEFYRESRERLMETISGLKLIWFDDKLSYELVDLLTEWLEYWLKWKDIHISCSFKDGFRRYFRNEYFSFSLALLISSFLLSVLPLSLLPNFLAFSTHGFLIQYNASYTYSFFPTFPFRRTAVNL